LPEESVGIWIDPIDATAQYINAKSGSISETGVHSEGLRCVTVLIGMYDRATGQPIFGCINQPFVQLDTDSQRWTGRYVWGISYNGLNVVSANSTLYDGLPNHPNARNYVVLSTSEDDSIQSKLGQHFQLVYAAGAGYKILCIVDRLVGSYLLSKDSTFKWDTCAPHAILLAQGGGIVDFNMALAAAKAHATRPTMASDGLAQLLADCQIKYHLPKPGYDCGLINTYGNHGGILGYWSTDLLVEMMQYLCTGE
jgi:inositol polyphosphate 1-phosphatase